MGTWLFEPGHTAAMFRARHMMAIRLFSLCFRSQPISERISRSSRFKARCQAENPPSIVRLTPLM